METKSNSESKSFLTTWLLSLLVGYLGVDRFYLGKVGTGVLKLLTVGGVGIWWFVDLVIILCNGMRDKKGNKLADYDKHKVIAIVVTIVVLALGSVYGSTQKSAQPSDNPVVSNTETKKDEEPKKDDTPAPKPKVWTKVAELSGSSDKSSETIHLNGGQVRLKYDFQGDMIVGAVYLLDEGTDLQKQGGFPEVTVSKAGADETILRKSAGDYYLHVTAANTQYAVTLEELK